MVTSSAADVRSTAALASDYVARILVGTTRIAIARLATVWIFRKSPIFWETLVTIASSNVTLASTFASHHVTSTIVNGTQDVAGAS